MFANSCRPVTRIPAIISQLATHHQLSESQIGPEVQQFIARLVEEQVCSAAVQRGSIAKLVPWNYPTGQVFTADF